MFSTWQSDVNLWFTFQPYPPNIPFCPETHLAWSSGTTVLSFNFMLLLCLLSFTFPPFHLLILAFNHHTHIEWTTLLSLTLGQEQMLLKWTRNRVVRKCPQAIQQSLSLWTYTVHLKAFPRAIYLSPLLNLPKKNSIWSQPGKLLLRLYFKL